MLLNFSCVTRWWLELLWLDLEHTWGWSKDTRRHAHLYADARGDPPRIAAVLFIDGQTYHTDYAPSKEIMDMFVARRDNQIMGQELLSIALGLCTFGHLLQSRKLVIFSDNVGAQQATSKGRARSFDHTCIAHCLWVKLAKPKAEATVERVPTKENIADLPSREEYDLLLKIGSSWIEPILDKAFCKPSAWDALAIPGVLCNKPGGVRIASQDGLAVASV